MPKIGKLPESPVDEPVKAEKPKQTLPEIPMPEKLTTLKDVQEAMAMLYEVACKRLIGPTQARDLGHLLSQLAELMQDQRDSKYKIQLKKLWAEFEARKKLLKSGVVDVNPTALPEGSPILEGLAEEKQKQDRVTNILNGQDAVLAPDGKPWEKP